MTHAASNLALARAATLLAFVAWVALPTVALSQPAAKPPDPTSAQSVIQQADTIAGRVVQLRGLPLNKTLNKNIKDRAALEVDLRRRLDTDYLPGEIEGEAALLVRLGLLPATLDYRAFLLALFTEQIAGYYDFVTAELVMIDGGAADFVGPAMAHEIFHAVQDQHFNLRALHPPRSGQAGSFTNGDRALARSALIEGDATVLMLDYALHEQGALVYGAGRSFIDFPIFIDLIEKLIDQGQAMATAQAPMLAKAPPILRRLLEFPYLGGMRFVVALRDGQPWSTVDAVYGDPPESTEQILHPERYFARDAPTLVALDLDAVRAALPGGAGAWMPIYENVWGELRTLIWLEEGLGVGAAARPIVPKEAAAGWDGDRFYLLRRGAHELIIAPSVWDSLRDAEDMAQALTALTRKQQPAASHHRADGPHGSLDCFHDEARGERTVIERWGTWLLYMTGVPLREDNGALYEQGALRDAVWKARRVGAYPPTPRPNN